jgi:predicted MFS family arabinose efflux permease
VALRSYGDLLRRPYVVRLVAFAFAARVPVAAQSLALLLLVKGTTGSYATAGLVTAANGICVGLFAPLQGRLIDTLGQTRVLCVAAVGNALMLAAVTALALGHAPAALLVVAAAGAGSLMPAITPAMQVLWPGLAGSEDRTRTAFALEAVTVELTFVCGPLVAAALSAAVSPAAAVIGAGTMTMLGTLAFAASGPSRAWRPSETRSKGLAGALASPGIRTIVLAALPAGVALGALEVGLPAFADSRGAAELGGLLLAAVALGSTTGGLWYGAQRSDASPGRRWLRLNVLLALGLAPLALAWDVPFMALACIVAGGGLAPLMSASWDLIARLAPDGRATDASAWYQTAMVGGTALGVAAGGVAIEQIGVGAALATPCVALCVAVAIGMGRRRSLTDGGRAAYESSSASSAASTSASVL